MKSERTTSWTSILRICKTGSPRTIPDTKLKQYAPTLLIATIRTICAKVGDLCS